MMNATTVPRHETKQPEKASIAVAGSKNFILVRDPAAIARSFFEVYPPTLEETCLPALCQCSGTFVE